MAILLQFCAFDSLVSRFIAYGTEGTVAHVDAVDDAGNLWGAQNETGLGGKPSGVQIRPEDYGDSCGMTNRIRVLVSATPAQEAAFWGFMRNQLGKPYDLTGIAGFIAGRDWHDDGAWFCSELVCAALEASGAIKKLETPANKITPQELLLVCSVIGDVVK
jgi:uncharacterized protein YycO